MDTHVKVLGVLNLALGAFGVLGAIVLMLIFGGAAGIVGASGDPDAIRAIPIIGIAGSAIVFFVLLLSIPGLIVGVGLLKFRPWARIVGIILSVLSLINFPLGTVVGIYGLWVLLNSETQRLFAGRQVS